MSVFQQSVEKAIFMWNAVAFYREHTAPLPNSFLQAKSTGLLIGTSRVLHACALQMSVMQIAHLSIEILLT
jgi:hypothetical protein